MPNSANIVNKTRINFHFLSYHVNELRLVNKNQILEPNEIMKSTSGNKTEKYKKHKNSDKFDKIYS